MKTLLAAAFAVMIGLSFAGSTFADEKKMDAPAGTTGTHEMSKDSKSETKTETKSEDQDGKKSKKSKKTTKTEEKTSH